jgi:hypothetical protein
VLSRSVDGGFGHSASILIGLGQHGAQ